MLQIAENVFVIGNRIACSNTVIIQLGRSPDSGRPQTILIDPGTTAYGNLHYLLKQLNPFQPITEIWLTHAHPDHSQAARTLKLLNPQTIKLSSHPLAKKILETPHPIIAFLDQQKGSVKPLLTRVFKENLSKPKVINGIILALCRWGVNLITMDWRKTKVDYSFKDGEIRYGIKVVYLPGHTPEEVGFFLQDEKILITGDLLAYGGRKGFNALPIPALNVPASDIDSALESLKIMQQLDPKLIIPAHGRIITNPKDALNKCIEMTKKLRDQAHLALHTSDSTFQVLLKWWMLYPSGCRLQQRLAMWGILAKSAMLKNWCLLDEINGGSYFL